MFVQPDRSAEIQRLTGELAQARKELREQDTEADRLTRELIQAQGELAQARAERDAALDAWRRMNEMHRIAPCSCGLQQTLAQVDAALAAPPCGDETPR
jgi:multidrug resistance efflux pump